MLFALKLFLFFLCFPFFIFATQKSGGPCSPSVTPVSRALFGIIRRNISLFILSLNSSEPYSRAFNRDSPLKLIAGGSIRQWSSWRLFFPWKEIGNARKKCLIVSISVPQLHRCLKRFSNLWRNLRLLKWLNFSRSLVSNFMPIWSCIENNVKIMWKTALAVIWNAWQI